MVQLCRKCVLQLFVILSLPIIYTSSGLTTRSTQIKKESKRNVTTVAGNNLNKNANLASVAPKLNVSKNKSASRRSDDNIAKRAILKETTTVIVPTQPAFESTTEINYPIRDNLTITAGNVSEGNASVSPPQIGFNNNTRASEDDSLKLFYNETPDRVNTSHAYETNATATNSTAIDRTSTNQTTTDLPQNTRNLTTTNHPLIEDPPPTNTSSDFDMMTRISKRPGLTEPTTEEAISEKSIDDKSFTTQSQELPSTINHRINFGIDERVPRCFLDGDINCGDQLLCFGDGQIDCGDNDDDRPIERGHKKRSANQSDDYERPVRMALEEASPNESIEPVKCVTSPFLKCYPTPLLNECHGRAVCKSPPSQVSTSQLGLWKVGLVAGLAAAGGVIFIIAVIIGYVSWNKLKVRPELTINGYNNTQSCTRV